MHPCTLRYFVIVESAALSIDDRELSNKNPRPGRILYVVVVRERQLMDDVVDEDIGRQQVQ